jgi:hypothetical protein
VTSSRLLAVLAATVLLLVPAVAARADETGRRTQVAVRWQGDGGHATLDRSLLGDLTVVPGDRAETVVAVRNDGPSDGTLAVSIVNTRLLEELATVDDGFADDLLINDVPVSRLLDGDTLVHEVPVARGAVAEVPLRHELPAGATSGNRGEGETVTVAFDVHLRITGDATSAQDGADGAAADRGAEGAIARTGGRAAADVRGLLAGAAALLVAAVVAAGRQHRAREGRR